MKSFLLLTGLLLFFILTACKEDDDQPQIDPLDQLPSPTQEGLRTFGALFNGEPWMNETTLDVSADFSETSFLAIYMGNDEDPRDINFAIIINDYNEEEDVFSIITNQDSLFAFADLNYNPSGKNGTCRYSKENTLKGFIEITKFDKMNRICSGTFEYTAVNEDCDTVRITNGRFDTWINF